MKKCSSCGKELPTSLDEYGDIREPVCSGCFLSGSYQSQAEKDEDAERIAELEEEMRDAQEQEEYYSGVVWACENELRDIKSKAKRRKIEQREMADKLQPAILEVM